MQTSKRFWLCLSALASLGSAGCGATPEDGAPELAETSAAITNGAVYTLRNVHNNLCLEVAGASTADGGNVQLWACNTAANHMRWRFEAVSGGFRVVNVHSGKCLDVAGRSSADGANVAQWSCNGGTNQTFRAEDVRSGGIIRLIAAHSGKTLDAWVWGTTNGTNIVQWPVTGGNNQLFTATQVGTSTGGGTTGGGTTGGGTTGGGTGTTGTTCANITNFGTVNTTIRVRAGTTFDGGCRRYIAGSALGDGSQSESQSPVFILENGATLRNVVLGSPAADGIHTEGSATLTNIHWEDVGEDALTIKESSSLNGTVVTLNGGSARNGEDKIFQINATSTFRLSNFRAVNAGKLIRQNGGTTFPVNVFIDRCDISDMDEGIFRTDSPSSRVNMTNTRYHNVGTLFIGVASGNATQSNNVQY